MPTDQARVFLSHSSADKEFVRRLRDDLGKADLKVWLDEVEIKAGDSIPQKIADGLSETDYLVAVLSKESVKSPWVQAELDAAMMAQLSGRGVVVLPIKIEGCEVPELLKPRLYADFRGDYEGGLAKLLEALGQEREPAGLAAEATSCEEKLAELSDGDLRRRITKRVGRDDLVVLWHDAFEESLQDSMGNTGLPNCVVELLVRSKRKPGARQKLYASLCDDYPDIVNP